MFTLSIVLTISGAVAAVTGLYWGALRTLRRYRELDDVLPKLQAVLVDPAIPAEEHAARRHDLLAPSGTWGHVEYVMEYSEFAVLSMVAKNLKWPALLTATGIVLGAAASIVSLWA
ncbi:hypothetical protein [Streptomyces xanthochromogenes]